jgi:hypothetical protein
MRRIKAGRCGAGRFMAEPASDAPDSLEAVVEQAIAICDGDVRAALRSAVIPRASPSLLGLLSDPVRARGRSLNRTREFGGCGWGAGQRTGQHYYIPFSHRALRHARACGEVLFTELRTLSLGPVFADVALILGNQIHAPIPPR